MLIQVELLYICTPTGFLNAILNYVQLEYNKTMIMRMMYNAYMRMDQTEGEPVYA